MRILFILLAAAAALSAQTLHIYAIDAEGGKSTLYVSPSGESMLVDTGYAGNNNRDANRRRKSHRGGSKGSGSDAHRLSRRDALPRRPRGRRSAVCGEDAHRQDLRITVTISRHRTRKRRLFSFPTRPFARNILIRWSNLAIRFR